MNTIKIPIDERQPRVRVDAEVLNELKDYCEENGVVIRFAATQAIREWVQRRRSREEAIAS